MRQIVLDTETTGLDWKSGDRVIEIGCVEILDRKLTGQHYHVYINPQRTIDAGAMAVHGGRIRGFRGRGRIGDPQREL